MNIKESSDHITLSFIPPASPPLYLALKFRQESVFWIAHIRVILRWLRKLLELNLYANLFFSPFRVLRHFYTRTLFSEFCPACSDLRMAQWNSLVSVIYFYSPSPSPHQRRTRTWHWPSPEHRTPSPRAWPLTASVSQFSDECFRLNCQYHHHTLTRSVPASILSSSKARRLLYIAISLSPLTLHSAISPTLSNERRVLRVLTNQRLVSPVQQSPQ